MTADAAAIAGVGLSEMGGVLNQVQTGQVAYTDSLNQLSDRGIPIYQWLAEEAGVAAGEVKDMASEGKISSEMFFAAIQKNIGGAAQEAGQTVTGAMQNAGAALGRFGAVVAGPVFNRAAGGFGSITEAIDGATAAITPFVDKFDRWLDSDGIPKAQEFGRTIAEMWGEFTGSGLVVGSITQVSATFGELLDTGRELAPAIQAIVESLVQASAAVGVSTWQVLLNTLDAAAQVADAVLVPALSTLSELMVENQGAVTAWCLRLPHSRRCRRWALPRRQRSLRCGRRWLRRRHRRLGFGRRSLRCAAISGICLRRSVVWALRCVRWGTTRRPSETCRTRSSTRRLLQVVSPVLSVPV